MKKTKNDSLLKETLFDCYILVRISVRDKQIIKQVKHNFYCMKTRDLRVDNSSTEAGTNKGFSSSEDVSVALHKFMLSKKRLGINMRATHVDTTKNWADPISRGKPLAVPHDTVSEPSVRSRAPFSSGTR